MTGYYVYHGILDGPPISELVAGVQQFLQRPNCQEVILLKFSHFKGFDDDSYLAFMTNVVGVLSPWYYSLPSESRLSGVTLSTIVGTGTSAMSKVILLSDYQFQSSSNSSPAGVYVYRDGAVACPQEKRSTNPTQGDLIGYDCYSNTESLSTMQPDQIAKFAAYTGNCDAPYSSTPCDLYLASWTLTPDYPTTVWSLAQQANPALPNAYPSLFTNANGQMVNILYTDYYETSSAFQLCYTQNGGS